MTNLGSAQINIQLKNGKLTVRHTNENGEILFQKDAIPQTWDAIWNGIIND